jgi:membrane protease YdiL (CAAX protease family)
MTTLSEQPAAKPHSCGYAMAAWVAIVLAVLTVFVGQLLLPHTVQGKKQTSNLLLEMEARQLVAAAQLDPATKARAYQDLGPLKDGDEGQKLRFVVLANELVGPEEALRQLDEIKLAEADAKVADSLRRLYRDYEAGHKDGPSVSTEDRQELERRLGWYGKLAQLPGGAADEAAREAILEPAQRTLYVTIGLGIGFIGCAALGLAFLVVLAVLLSQKIVHLHFTAGSPNGGIYAETFAIWMWVFMGLGIGVNFLPTGQNRILLGALLALSTLAVLAWPVLRGIPWSTVTQEIGLDWQNRSLEMGRERWQDAQYAGSLGECTRLPRSPAFVEPIFGIAGYLATLPLLFVGALLSLGLMRLAKTIFGEGDPLGIGTDASHPIAGYLLTTDWWGRLQVVLAASVSAPIVEETMFRGVLYRHLRDATGCWGRWLSVLAGAMIVSFIFAMVHPQGLLAVPALMALAIGFSLIREWRGTLVPSMVAHGLNNLMVTVLLLVTMG